MEKDKRNASIAIAAIVILIALWLAFRSDSVDVTAPASNVGNVATTTNSNNPNGFPLATKPMPIEDFVEQNISALSRASGLSEQVGGTFFVTDIEAHGGAGTVSYEDGHNAYTADFTYELSEVGIPRITAFIPRSKG